VTRAATKRIADAVYRALRGSDTREDRGEKLTAYARCLVGAWVDRCATAEKRLVELEGLARAVHSGPEGCVTTPPCGACAWCRLGSWLRETPDTDDRLLRSNLADAYAHGHAAAMETCTCRLGRGTETT
jgi:hypothetical protein